jgi:excisionase family DNA binding protein
MPERLLTLKQVETASGVSRATVYRWRHEHGLKMVKVGGCVRIREADWQAFIAKNTISLGEEGERSEASTLAPTEGDYDSLRPIPVVPKPQ